MPQKYIEVNIKKPLYSTFVNIRDIYINQAKRLKIPLRITIPQGVGIYTADEWLKGAKRVEQVFLRPNEPMILYGKLLEVGHTPKLIGKSKKVSEAWNKFNAMSPEEQYKFTH